MEASEGQSQPDGLRDGEHLHRLHGEGRDEGVDRAEHADRDVLGVLRRPVLGGDRGRGLRGGLGVPGGPLADVPRLRGEAPGLLGRGVLLDDRRVDPGGGDAGGPAQDAAGRDGAGRGHDPREHPHHALRRDPSLRRVRWVLWRAERAVEDVAIAYGYNNIQRKQPPTLTTGAEQPINQLCVGVKGTEG